ncbi:MAG: hypothetical protein AAFQ63_10420 [Cyanobacteria bacterium J06621_11]
MDIATEYLNTDFELKSKTSFDALHRELERGGSVLHYVSDEGGDWYLVFESATSSNPDNHNAERDILSSISLLSQLSREAKSELATCYLREFNIGFSCGDTWAYSRSLTASTVQAIAEANCSISVTLYPTHNLNKEEN